MECSIPILRSPWVDQCKPNISTANYGLTICSRIFFLFQMFSHSIFMQKANKMQTFFSVFINHKKNLLGKKSENSQCIRSNTNDCICWIRIMYLSDFLDLKQTTKNSHKSILISCGEYLFYRLKDLQFLKYKETHV